MYCDLAAADKAKYSIQQQCPTLQQPTRSEHNAPTQPYLHDRRDVDGVPRGSCGGKGRLGLGRVSQGVVHPSLDEVRLHEELLVVHALQLTEELVQQRHGVLVLALLEQLDKKCGAYPKTKR